MLTHGTEHYQKRGCYSVSNLGVLYQALLQVNGNIIHASIVAISVCQRKVNIAYGVQGSDHSDSWGHCMNRLNIGAFTFSPFHPAEIALVQPRFVKIY